MAIPAVAAADDENAKVRVGHFSPDAPAVDVYAGDAAILTDVVVAVVREFDVALDELHNDSTSIRFCGQYKAAQGRKLRGKRAPAITYGFSKDHRPDLKLFEIIKKKGKRD